LGFKAIGVARRHVQLGEDWHDEVFMEVQLSDMTLD
jgi:hypothetical protein